MSQDRSDPSLLSFFIFNLNLGQKEGEEHEKLLYYFPSKDDLDTQVKKVGLAEAITRFSLNFTNNRDCESVHTQKTRQIFFQPEKDIWMVMIVSVGWIRKQRDSGPFREYQSEGVQDSVLRSRLVNSYRAFKLQYHSFAAVEEQHGLGQLKSWLSSFFNEHLKTEVMSTGDLLTVWSGISFLPLDRQTFLQVHCCLSLLQSTLPCIRHTAFLYNNSVVWCGLCMEDLRSLSQFLTSRLKSHPVQQPTNSHSSSPSRRIVASPPSSSSSYLSRFVGSGTLPSHKVYLHNDKNDFEPYHLLIYSLAGALLCITLPEFEKLTNSLYEKIAKTLDAKVSQLASDIGEQLNKKSSINSNTSNSDNFKYIYHNHMNLATKTTMHSSNITFSTEVMQTLVDMHQDIQKQQSSELVVKTSQDHWLVGRCGNGREYYVVVSHKNANLVEVTDEVNRMCSSHFNNIFMID